MKTGEILRGERRPVTLEELESLVWAVSGTRNTDGVRRLMEAVELFIAWRVAEKTDVEWMPTRAEARAGAVKEEESRRGGVVSGKVRALRAVTTVPAPVLEATDATGSEAELPLVECSKCGELLPRGEGGMFHRDRTRAGGWHTACKDCRAQDRGERTKTRVRIPEARGGKRACTRCGVPKFEDEFYRRKSGLSGQCKECERAKSRDRERSNREARERMLRAGGRESV